LTQKGDLLTRNLYDHIRLGVGSDGYTLIADSSQPEGIKWALLDPNPFTSSVHEDADSLVHNLSEDSFEEYVYSGTNVAQIVVWENSLKLKKIRESVFTYSGTRIISEANVQYDDTGVEIQRLLTNYVYDGTTVISATNQEIL